MARPKILFPDATAVMRDYLVTVLSVPVYSRVPDPRPGSFVRVKRVGGYRKAQILDRARLDIHFWADSEEGAADLCALARAHIIGMAGPHGATVVYDVREVGGPQWLPDPESSQPRYAMAFELSLRGQELDE